MILHFYYLFIQMAKSIYLIFILSARLFQTGKLTAQEYVVGGDFD